MAFRSASRRPLLRKANNERLEATASKPRSSANSNAAPQPAPPTARVPKRNSDSVI